MKHIFKMLFDEEYMYNYFREIEGLSEQLYENLNKISKYGKAMGRLQEIQEEIMVEKEGEKL